MKVVVVGGIRCYLQVCEGNALFSVCIRSGETDPKSNVVMYRTVREFVS